MWRGPEGLQLICSSLGGITTGVSMHRLSDEELAAGSSLGRRLVSALRAGRVPAPHTESFTDGITVRIPAAAAEVGDLEVSEDGEEYTLYIGRHTHTHFTPALFDGPNADSRETQALERLVWQLERIVRDEVVNPSPLPRRRGLQLEATPTLMSPNARAWLWSGKAYQPSA